MFSRVHEESSVSVERNHNAERFYSPKRAKPEFMFQGDRDGKDGNEENGEGYRVPNERPHAWT